MKHKKRVLFVCIFLLLFIIFAYITLKGEYLQMLGIGEEYISIYIKDLLQTTIIFGISFIIIYILVYLTTVSIKKGLKQFFKEDKKEMPKLPNKSISFIASIILGTIITILIKEKALLAFNISYFNKADPIFGLDIGYYMFIKPFIQTVLDYLIKIIIGLSFYMAAYYIIIFNKFFNEGINVETLKKSKFIKQLLNNVLVIVVLFSMLNLLKTQDVLYGDLITVGEDITLTGAGLTDVTIKICGNIIFSIVIIVCAILGIKNFKKQEIKKMAISLSIIPAFLIGLFIIMFGFDIIYVNNNRLDKEKGYIYNNISYTKEAFGINIDEVEIKGNEAITTEDISKNSEVINNVNILNDEVVLQNLEEYQTSLGYYTFKNTKIGNYNNELVYLSPREIVNNDTRTYKNKTFEYTHGYGLIINSASTTDNTGHLNYVKSGFTETDDETKIIEPRIYFGLQTNNSIVTNKEEKEYDYPLTSTTNSYTTYSGQAGQNLSFLDRLILGIKEGDLNLAFSTKTNSESNIITTRNIINRAKKLMPYLEYDENPYLVIRDSGELVWVIDAYTMSSNYPYSQIIKTKINNSTEKINYIRNSVKVIVDAYNGTMKFYITDRTDPIVMSYYNIHSELFENPEENIPEDIRKHLLYSEILYNAQAKALETYHNIQPEVLYRADDIWNIARENTNMLVSLNGTEIQPYYTMLKTVDKENAELGLVLPYTIYKKQNIKAYLVGTYDVEKNKQVLTMYKYVGDAAILGTMQLDTLIEENENISKQIDTLNVTGAKVEKNIIVVPIDNKLLYVESIYQTKLNENNKVPILKKIVVASGNKIAIGNDLKSALEGLLSQEAVSIDVETQDLDSLLNQIIKANNNLKESNKSNDWEMIGRDLSSLQSLIDQLQEITKKEDETKTNILYILE